MRGSFSVALGARCVHTHLQVMICTHAAPANGFDRLATLRQLVMSELCVTHVVLVLACTASELCG